MENFDFKWVLYLIAALYFIFRSKKKKTPAETEYKPFESDNQPTSTAKPVTFEDLLKEIQQSKLPKPQPKPEPVRPFYEVPKYEDYDDDLKNEERDLEEVGYDYRKEDKIYETYEKAKQAAFNRPSLEETMNVKDTVVRFGHFKGYETQQEETVAQSIAKELQNKENVKRAFVLSEILSRRF